MADDTTDEERDAAAEASEGPDADDLDGPADDADDDADEKADDADEKADDADEKADDDAPNTTRDKSDDDDDDDDIVDDDDVEADLDRILKDRMVTVEDEEAEADEPDDRSGGGERLQPKQRDEQLCSACFLLVRSNAPNCPVGDDDCPIFS